MIAMKANPNRAIGSLNVVLKPSTRSNERQPHPCGSIVGLASVPTLSSSTSSPGVSRVYIYTMKPQKQLILFQMFTASLNRE